MAIHIIKGTAAPTDAPPEVGCHFIDQTNEVVYQAVGTAAAADWIQLGGSSSTYTTFKSLLDTPADYTGEAGKFAVVNGNEDALEFVAQAAGVTEFTGLTDTPANYTGEAGKLSRVNLGEDGLVFDDLALGEIENVDVSGVEEGHVLQYDLGTTTYKPEYRVEWLGPWVATNYTKSQMVIDGAWTMISNTATSDRAAPQTIGDPAFALPEAPTWIQPQQPVNAVMGVKLTLGAASIIDGIRVWRPTSGTNADYTLVVKDITDPTNPILLSVQAIPTGDAGWVTIGLKSTLYLAGTVLDAYLFIQTHTANSTWTHTWTLSAIDGSTPVSQSYTSDSTFSTLRVHKDADGPTDVSTDMNLLKEGDELTFFEFTDAKRFNTYIITGLPVLASDVYTIPVVRTGSGQSVRVGTLVQADAAIDAGQLPSDYVYLANWWTNNPPVDPSSSAKGYLKANPEDTEVLDNNGYGIDLRGAVITKSDDWDVVAYSAAASGGGGGGSELFTDLADTPSTYVGKSKALVFVNEGETALSFGPVPEISFETTGANTTHSEGKMIYDEARKCFAFYNDRTAVSLQVGRETWRRAVNNTGVTITNGTVVSLTGWDDPLALPEIVLADHTTLALSMRTIGVATEEIIDGESGEVTGYGEVGGLDTSTFTSSETVWLGEGGAFTNVEPIPPYYPVRLGTVGKVHSTEGSLLVHISPFTGTDTSVNSDGILNGICPQKQSVDFVVSGGVIYADVINEQVVGTPLPFIIDGVRYNLDTLTGGGVGGAARVALTAGADANSTQINFIYIENDPTPTLKSSTTFPYVSKAWIGIVSVFDAATTNADGPFSWQRFNNAIDNGAGDGAMNFITERLRQQGAIYQSGVVPTVTIDTGAAPDSVKVATSSGIISQLHSQSFAAQDGNTYYVINDPDVGIRKITDLNQITKYADGTIISDNQRLGLNILATQSSSNGTDILLVSLPDGGYNTDDGAINDIANFANVSVPTGTNLSSTTVRLYRIVLRYDTQAGGQWANLLGAGGFQDERGFLLSSGGGSGGTGGGFVSDFSDADFSVYNVVDPTKVAVLDLSGLTTTSTRTLAVQDANGTIGYDEDIQANALAITGKENTITATSTADYYRGDKTFNTLNSAAVGLGNVDNTSDADKPVSTAQQTALDLKAPIASPTFTGTVTAPDTDITGTLKVTGVQYSVPAANLFPTTTTEVIDLSTSNVQTVNLDHSLSALTIWLSNGVAGASYVLKIVQDSSSPRTVSWNSDIKWSGGTPPVISTGSLAVDIINFIYDGANYYGAFVQDFS